MIEFGRRLREARTQAEGLGAAQDQLASGKFVMGSHHLSLAVYTDSLPELERLAGMARSELANAGAVVARESLGMEAAYFARLPGNLDWRTRPGAIASGILRISQISVRFRKARTRAAGDRQ